MVEGIDIIDDTLANFAREYTKKRLRLGFKHDARITHASDFMCQWKKLIALTVRYFARDIGTKEIEYEFDPPTLEEYEKQQKRKVTLKIDIRDILEELPKLLEECSTRFMSVMPVQPEETSDEES